MNTVPSTFDFNPLPTALDRILAEIAFSVQLPPSLHRKATERYRAVREYLEGTEKFEDQIEHFYPQGSMAIDATISARGTDGEYDIDIVAQLGTRFRGKRPNEILDDLFEALDGYRGLTVKRQTRCVTIYYADGMHLDITPALRDAGYPERQSVIAHSKGPLARPDDTYVPMNAYGFVDWYRERTPEEINVIRDFDRRWRDYAALNNRADADVDEVPDQTEFVVKNTATLALQLIKRYRNIRYAKYDGRIPPSVMLSYFAGCAAKPNTSLADLLTRLCRLIIAAIREASGNQRMLLVANPSYNKDVFTDRWPESVSQQNEFARYLEELVTGLERAKSSKFTAWDLNQWLRNMFGDRVVTAAADRLADELGNAVREASHSYTAKGGIILPAAVGVAAPAVARAATPAVKHNFYGRKMK